MPHEGFVLPHESITFIFLEGQQTYIHIGLDTSRYRLSSFQDAWAVLPLRVHIISVTTCSSWGQEILASMQKRAN